MAVFLTENGVLSMGNKTPVTILQETLQRRGITPQYDLIHNGVGTLDPVFKYEVKYKTGPDTQLSAVGSGKSKKEAKHDAAAVLLKRMQPSRAVTENENVQGKEQVDIASPYSGALKQNYVGMLEEVCVVNKLPLAVFVPVSEAGPPHARIFTMMCKVSSCTETAVARTKKQAKHLVAQLMITRLNGILGDDFIPPAEKSTEYVEPLDLDEPKSMHLKAIESGSFRHDLSIPLSEIHNVFHYRMEEFLIPEIFLDLGSKPENYFEHLADPKKFLDELLSGLEGTCKIVPLSDSLIEEAVEEMDNIAKKYCWGHGDDYSPKESQSDQNEDYPNQNESDSKERFILEEFDLGIPQEKPLCSSNEQPHPYPDQNESDSKERFILEEFDLGIPQEKPSCSNEQPHPYPDQNESDSKEQFILEEFDLGIPQEKPLCSNEQPHPVDNFRAGSEEIVNLDMFSELSLTNNFTQHNVKNELESTNNVGRNLHRIFMSVICPQGRWAFFGYGPSVEEATNMASIACLKFFRIMSLSPKVTGGSETS